MWLPGFILMMSHNQTESDLKYMNLNANGMIPNKTIELWSVVVYISNCVCQLVIREWSMSCLPGTLMLIEFYRPMWPLV